MDVGSDGVDGEVAGPLFPSSSETSDPDPIGISAIDAVSMLVVAEGTDPD